MQRQVAGTVGRHPRAGHLLGEVGADMSVRQRRQHAIRRRHDESRVQMCGAAPHRAAAPRSRTEYQGRPPLQSWWAPTGSCLSIACRAAHDPSSNTTSVEPQTVSTTFHSQDRSSKAITTDAGAYPPSRAIQRRSQLPSSRSPVTHSALGPSSPVGSAAAPLPSLLANRSNFRRHGSSSVGGNAPRSITTPDLLGASMIVGNGVCPVKARP